ncbi:MAG: acetyl-CoA carboxylase biotin carboxylase subunit [Alphaproteobacteria bacterium]|nr:acetyl-CoA carboxylase biotin carboxylase subunit [Alphaproteobacteria bacterium]
MRTTPFSKLLVANRGEIAVRIIRSARAAGIATVAVYSEADAGAEHVRAADESICIGKASPHDSYLRIDGIIEAARVTRADAIHPGYGFLAENAGLPEACAKAGVVFVGPSAEAIRVMGNKAAAKALMTEVGVPCIPGYHGREQGTEALQTSADAIGYPVMIKAVAAGGGRGMRLVETAADFKPALKSAKSEAKAAFDDDTVLLERAIVNPRHIEIQVFGDRYGNAIHLGERDCSVQRRHQKLIEEAPSPAVSVELRAEMGAAAVRAVRAIGYEGAGTLEFLLAQDGRFYFMEMNTRLQVEHPVTEAVTGLDLVALQFEIAAGRQLPIRQEDVRFCGHAIEVRLCAEDPEQGFAPQSGTLSLWSPSPALRIEHGLRRGADVPPFYDSMIAKLVAHGSDRDAARRKLIRGLEDTVALGVRTNQGYLADCLAHPAFVKGEATTAFIGVHQGDLLADRSGEEITAAVYIAAMLRSAPDVSITHAFPAPIRLRRGDRVFEMRVFAGRNGHCRVEYDGVTTLLQVAGAGADACELVEQGRAFRVPMGRRGEEVWAHIGGRAWGFEDITFKPVAGGEAEGDGKVRASMNGRVIALDVAVGDKVVRGQRVLVVEAMKMEHAHVATIDGIVEAIHVAEGDQVEAHRIIIEVAAA